MTHALIDAQTRFHEVAQNGAVVFEVCAMCGRPWQDQPTERESLALAALRRVTRRSPQPSTLAVAMEMEYSTRWAYEFLHRLEERGYVCRPDGPRSGWAETAIGRRIALAA